MINKEDLDRTLRIFKEYQLLSEKDSNVNLQAILGRKINIQKEVNADTFIVLQAYYLEEYRIKLNRADLSSMDVRLLSKVKYEKLSSFKGIGQIDLFRFKMLLINHSVFVPLE